MEALEQSSQLLPMLIQMVRHLQVLQHLQEVEQFQVLEANLEEDPWLLLPLPVLQMAEHKHLYLHV